MPIDDAMRLFFLKDLFGRFLGLMSGQRSSEHRQLLVRLVASELLVASR